jgi:hypothetical protein
VEEVREHDALDGVMLFFFDLAANASNHIRLNDLAPFWGISQ